MSKNTSISLGSHFEQFIQYRIEEGRYKNASEIVRAGLRLLEAEEQKFLVLKNAIQEGLDSPKIMDFDFDDNLKELKAARRKNG